MKQKRRGITLVEMLIALGISVPALVFALTLLTNFTNMYSQNRATLENESDLMFIERDLKRFFDRAAAVAMTQRNPPGPTVGLGVGRAGTVILLADLRPCNLFNPLTTAAAGNRSQVRVTCCDRNQAMRATVPLGGGRVNVVSQCRITNGLSVEVVTNAGTTYTRCYTGVSEMDVGISGFDEVNQASVYFWNIATPSGLALGGGRGIAQLRSRLQLYLSPGFGGRQEAVTCQTPLGFGVGT